jgi:tripeptide aminopeptidase
MINALPAPPASPVELFLALVRVASPSQREGELANLIQRWLRSADIPFTVDEAWKITGSDTGNIVARAWRSSAKPTVLFLAHLDTVQREGSVIEPVLGDDGVIRSSEDTILGADNKAAVAALLSLLARGHEDHANAIFVFSTCEERGRMGVTALQDLAAEIDLAFPVDGSYPVGTVLEAALGQVPFDLRVTGREAHAAKAPEKGVNAVKAASDVVAQLEMGWSGNALLNISEIRGGSETNVVPGFAEIRGEARAFSEDSLIARLSQVQSTADAVSAATGATLELVLRPKDGAPPFPPAENSACAKIAAAAAADTGLTLSPQRCAATLEANFLHAMGLPTLGIASGGPDPHSVDESLAVDELNRLVAFLDAILRRAGSGGLDGGPIPSDRDAR